MISVYCPVHHETSLGEKKIHNPGTPQLTQACKLKATLQLEIMKEKIWLLFRRMGRQKKGEGIKLVFLLKDLKRNNWEGKEKLALLIK